MGSRTANLGMDDSQVSKVEVVSPTGMPRGIPYIIGNEAAERFSYYGMRTILVVFMTQYLMARDGALATMSDADAKAWYHIFMSANYFFPILGAFVSDIFWGKYKTIMRLSVVYCLGHLALALDETRLGLTLGLTLIAIGSGGIKPSVSAHVGDQFTAENQHSLSKAFNLFYFSINFGAFFSTMLTPWLLEHYGPSVAFGLPGVLMLIATIVFKMGDKVYVAIPPVGWETYKKEIFSPQGKKAIINLSIVYVFISMFWALYDQNGSSWVLQAEKMDRVVNLFGWKFEIMASQLQAINPILVLASIPLFSYWIYPAMERVMNLTSLRKIWIGMFIAALSFVIVAMAESRIQAGETVSIMWQVWAFVILTIAEVMVYGTGLEFSYTQAPKSMKSFIMGMFLLTISAGNFFAAFVNFFIQNPDGSSKLEGASYYWFFTALITATAVLFIACTRNYKEECYVQSHDGLGH